MTRVPARAASTTTWQSLTAENPFVAGGGAFALVAHGESFPTALVGARAGVATDGEDVGRAAFQVFAKASGPDARILFMTAPPALLAPGASLALGESSTEAVVYAFQLGLDVPPALVGFVSGSLSLAKWGPKSLSPVTAAVSGTLYGFPSP